MIMGKKEKELTKTVEVRADKESARRNASAASGGPESVHPDDPYA